MNGTTKIIDYVCSEKRINALDSGSSWLCSERGIGIAEHHAAQDYQKIVASTIQPFYYRKYMTPTE